MDALLHRVMRQLMATASDGTTSAPAYALARRLAATHPHLVIRYLPLVASNLQVRNTIARTRSHFAHTYSQCYGDMIIIHTYILRAHYPAGSHASIIFSNMHPIQN